MIYEIHCTSKEIQLNRSQLLERRATMVPEMLAVALPACYGRHFGRFARQLRRRRYLFDNKIHVVLLSDEKILLRVSGKRIKDTFECFIYCEDRNIFRRFLVEVMEIRYHMKYFLGF